MSKSVIITGTASGIGEATAAELRARGARVLGLDTGRFATCCLLWLMPDTGVARIASAGHHIPVVRTPDGRRLVREVDVGIPLGIDQNAYYKTTDVGLEPETLLVLSGTCAGSPTRWTNTATFPNRSRTISSTQAPATNGWPAGALSPLPCFGPMACT